MTYFTDANNALYFLDTADAENYAQWLPPGVTAITDAEATLIQNPPPTIAQAQAVQIELLNAAYQAAIVAPVSYTTKAGITAWFSQDAASKTNLLNAIAGATASGNWSLNLWLDTTGHPVTPFTFVDLQGLAAAMESADTPEFTHLLTKIAAVQAATTVAEVQSVTW